MTNDYKFVSFLVYLISLSQSLGLHGSLYKCQSEQRIVSRAKKSSSNKIVQKILHKLFVFSGVFR